MTSIPSVSVLVLNRNGIGHLDACLCSLDALEFPSERLTIQVIDNGSTDGSLDFVRRRFPRVQVLALETNLGFARAYNIAVERAGSEFVAFLNNDTRVEPDWLSELVSAADRHRASAVASRILNWSGDRIDFAGGVLSFIGHAWQRDFGQPATSSYTEDPLLFSCAASALMSRTAFLEAGGFDADFFAYFEDVDLGWRLNLLGHKTVFAPKAVTRHRLHGTFSRIAFAQRLRLYERNALAMIYKNYEAETLERVLPAAVALSLLRGLIKSGVDTLELDFSSQPSASVSVEPALAAHLIALEDFSGQLSALALKRRAVQQARRRSDAELFRLFGDPLRLHDLGSRYEEIARALIRDFGIEQIVQPAGPRAGPRTAMPAQRRDPEVRTVSNGSGPTVSVVILSAIGPEHLPECLLSLRAQNYPLDECEVIVVDNGSPSGLTAQVEAWYPGATVVRNATNLGFARGNNIGASRATGQYLVFLNDDTRVHPDWLQELISTARRRNAAAVAACLLDWEGRTVDFAGGAVSFEGKGFQSDYGSLTESVTLEEKPLLFPCGGAVLLERKVFEQVGGWDDEAFAYYEDVELGWRLNLLGYTVWFSPRAVVYHKHHGTSGQWAEAPRLRLYERNSLRTIYSLLDVRSLARVLPAALMLAADRAILASGLSRATAEASLMREPQHKLRRLTETAKSALRRRGVSRQQSVVQAVRRLGLRGAAGVLRDVARATLQGVDDPRQAYLIECASSSGTVDAKPVCVPLPAAATLSGIFGFLSDLPGLSARRQKLQASRRASDGELLSAFGSRWTEPCGSTYPAEHRQYQQILVECLDIANLVQSPSPAVRVDKIHAVGG